MSAPAQIASRQIQSPMNDLIAGQPFADLVSIDPQLHLPCDSSRDYAWAEQKYRVSEITALVARYRNIPSGLQADLDRMIASGYGKNLFLAPFYEASLLILSSGVIPGFKALAERAGQLYDEYCSSSECQRASDFVVKRQADDIVILVLKAGTLVGSMTLYPFDKKKDLPSLSYLRLGPTHNRLLEVPALEVGRLAKAIPCGDVSANPDARRLNTIWIAAAFLVARDFVEKNGLLSNPSSFVCGDTHGSLIASLQHFFPLKIVASALRTDILDTRHRARDVAIYFLQREVLGSFRTSHDLSEALAQIADSDPDLAARIAALMAAGLKAAGIKSLQKFDPQKFRINFFYFPYHHADTRLGLQRLEKMLNKLTAARPITWH
jgi:hypothetical protein